MFKHQNHEPFCISFTDIHDDLNENIIQEQTSFFVTGSHVPESKVSNLLITNRNDAICLILRII